METLSNLASGFQVALDPYMLAICLIGVTVGTLVGVLPGIGAMAAISIALPITYHMDTTAALIMLAGIFYGAQYGGSTAAILLNLPGTATNAVTCLDGYPMSKQGRAGVALFMTTITSFVGGCIGIVLMIGFAPALSRFALSFSSAEYFSIMLLGLVAASTLSVGSPLKGLAMVVMGIALGLVGIDVTSGHPRYTFGVIRLMDGVNLLALGMGLFGVAEILNNLGKPTQQLKAGSVTLRSLLPSREDWKASVMPTVRGAAIGSGVGTLPGTGPGIAAFMAYAVEKRVAKDPSRFGHGAIEGIASPEAANNAAVQAAFIPTLSLGIPGDAVIAILMGAMLIHGIVPGPQFITSHPDTFWGLIASFWIGNVLLLILNIPMIGIWVRILTIPYRLLYPAMLFFVCVGVYAMRNNPFDVYLTMLFGGIGYFMLRFQYPAAPLLLGFILGPLMEEHLKRALQISRGDFLVFVDRPISAVFLVATLLVFAFTVKPAVMRALSRRSRAES
ncbi:tripartite tricarboxylate transporter permease [Oricola sp.]|uniref:tripartite tricarboxylate transporter permease n=1 Tax=Oricola sp. TaxID=1979950 RepID=UPI0025F7B457|nr:tripartite tricarboxylate transporter permease [Oricola sp.]MCI5075078.1 tripartite tricarboxylate transporter permease [Oricola sp.]